MFYVIVYLSKTFVTNCVVCWTETDAPRRTVEPGQTTVNFLGVIRFTQGVDCETTTVNYLQPRVGGRSEHTLSSGRLLLKLSMYFMQWYESHKIVSQWGRIECPHGWNSRSVTAYVLRAVVSNLVHDFKTLLVSRPTRVKHRTVVKLSLCNSVQFVWWQSISFAFLASIPFLMSLDVGSRSSASFWCDSFLENGKILPEVKKWTSGRDFLSCCDAVSYKSHSPVLFSLKRCSSVTSLW